LDCRLLAIRLQNFSDTDSDSGCGDLEERNLTGQGGTNSQPAIPAPPKGKVFPRSLRSIVRINFLLRQFPSTFWPLFLAIGRIRFDQMAAAWTVLAVLLVAAQASAAPVVAPAFLWAPKNYRWVACSTYLFRP
jgi:hypothetical protein